METRSRRQQAAQRPTYPQVNPAQATVMPVSSTASSAFQSSSSLASIQSPTITSPLQTSNPAYSNRAGPMPSPMANQSSNYFGSIAANAALPQQPSQQPRAQLVQTNSYLGQRGGGNGAPETAPFLNNFNLVAEAAKRAEMACLMRDMGDVEL